MFLTIFLWMMAILALTVYLNASYFSGLAQQVYRTVNTTATMDANTSRMVTVRQKDIGTDTINISDSKEGSNQSFVTANKSHNHPGYMNTSSILLNDNFRVQNSDPSSPAVFTLKPSF